MTAGATWRRPCSVELLEGYYYLVAFNEKHDGFANYRVASHGSHLCVQVEEPAAKNERVATCDPCELESRAFGMYAGRARCRWSRCSMDESVMGAVIDRFGKDVESLPAGEGWARVYAVVMKSPVLFGWLAQFGDRVHIEKPAWLAPAEYLRLPGGHRRLVRGVTLRRGRG